MQHFLILLGISAYNPIFEEKSLPDSFICAHFAHIFLFYALLFLCTILASRIMHYADFYLKNNLSDFCY